ncbi:hypothetical protein O6H91_08G051900 [Diphasiastrum complanatum]|uniref:Uncharacterized protein n=1 Tax=Diphasiastrum complanatum TaxID=34168 RepID=A0ACC2CXK1_DIPCM|nr:hypothetical protein O6H91_08G051900 [Diphasiastrum complanatum]
MQWLFYILLDSVGFSISLVRSMQPKKTAISLYLQKDVADDSPYKALQNPSHTASAKRTNDQEHMNQQVTDMLPFLSSAHGRPTRIATAAAPCCIFTHGCPAIFYTALILARALA